MSRFTQKYKSPNGEFDIQMSSEKKETKEFIVSTRIPRKTSIQPPCFKGVKPRHGKTYQNYTYRAGLGWVIGTEVTYTEYKHTFIGRWSHKFLKGLNLSGNRNWGKVTIQTQSKDEHKRWLKMIQEEMEKALVKMEQDKDKIIRVTAGKMRRLYEAYTDDDFASELIVEP